MEPAICSAIACTTASEVTSFPCQWMFSVDGRWNRKSISRLRTYATTRSSTPLLADVEGRSHLQNDLVFATLSL